MPAMTEIELKKRLEQGPLPGVILLYGEEPYLVCRWASRLLAKAADGGFTDFNAQRFDGAQVGADEIADAVEALPFMAGMKGVTVSDFDVEKRGAAEVEKLYELVANVPESTSLILYLPGVAVDLKKSAKWKKFIAAVNKVGVSVAFPRRSAAELEKLLCAAAAKRHAELSRQNAAAIIRSAGNGLQTLLNELEKLCAYVGEGEISVADIELLVTKNLETTVFALSKAILSGDYDKAYNTLSLLFYQNEEPVAVLAVLSSAYVDMYRVRAALQSGKSAGEPAAYADYKGKEFRLRYAESDARNLSLDMLRESLFALLGADSALKSARGDRRIVMEKLIAQLLLIAGKG